MPEKLDDQEFEIGGQKIGGGTTIRFTIKTMLWALGLAYIGLGYLYYDLRSEFKENNGISAEEKREFMEDIKKDYDGKFSEMLIEIYGIKGDVKVILDRTTRMEPILPNRNGSIESVNPPAR